MKWQGRRQSSNVNDLASKSRGGRRNMGMMSGGVGSLVLMLILYLFFNGQGLDFLFTQNDNDRYLTQTSTVYEEKKEFMRVILASTEDVWSDLFEQEGLRYSKPQLTFFSDAVHSECGYQSAAVGPFYCPADETIYIDLTFFDQLETKFKAKGDFAQAYVLAHEVGHHVQHLLGILERVNLKINSLNKTQANKLLVGLELQADYFAGVWAHYVQDWMDIGDLEEGLNAAYQIGDDTLQMRSQGHVVPENFTHGTSEQRRSWLLKGFNSGTIQDGNTFADLEQY